MYNLPRLNKTKWVYYTAVGKNHVNLEKDIVSFVNRTKTKLAFNPGSYQLERGAKSLKSALSATEVLFVNKEEGYKLVGRCSESELLNELANLGPNIVVVTDGSKGAYAFDGKEKYHMKIYPAKVVEMTGAGDAFATGFLGALNNGKDIKEALRWGTSNSTSVIGCIGPQEGLLNRAGMEKMLRKFSKIKPKKLKG